MYSLTFHSIYPVQDNLHPGAGISNLTKFFNSSEYFIVQGIMDQLFWFLDTKMNALDMVLDDI